MEAIPTTIERPISLTTAERSRVVEALQKFGIDASIATLIELVKALIIALL